MVFQTDFISKSIIWITTSHTNKGHLDDQHHINNYTKKNKSLTLSNVFHIQIKKQGILEALY